MNLKYFSEMLKKLPRLTEIKLDLSCNDLGQNQENLIHIKDGLNNLVNLKSIKLNLSYNQLG